MASWSRRELGRLPCREFREANRYQTEHLEQLPGVNYIMSLRDRKASKKGCCAVHLCAVIKQDWWGGGDGGVRGERDQVWVIKICLGQHMPLSASNMKWIVTENQRWGVCVKEGESENYGQVIRSNRNSLRWQTWVLTGKLFTINITGCISLGTIIFNLAGNMQCDQLRPTICAFMGAEVHRNKNVNSTILNSILIRRCNRPTL